MISYDNLIHILDTKFVFPFVMPSRNYLQKRTHHHNIDLRLQVMAEISFVARIDSISKISSLFSGSNIFCHIDTTQYHKNQIPIKLEQVILSSCTHVLFSSADTNFDTIANNWYSSQSNGINKEI